MPRIVTWLSITMLAGIVLTPFLVFGIYTDTTYKRALLPQYEQRAEVVAIGIERRVELGLKLFGDLYGLRDISQILENAKINSPETSFIVVTDSDGAIVAQVPKDIPDLEAKLELSQLQPETIFDRINQIVADSLYRLSGNIESEFESKSRLQQDYLITGLPLSASGTDGDVAGYVYLGTSTEPLELLRRELFINMLIVFAAAMLLGFECLLLIAGVRLLTPLSALQFLRERLQSGDLTHTARVSGYFGSSELIRQTNRFVERAASRAQSIGKTTWVAAPKSGDATREWHPSTAGLIRLPLVLFFLSEAILRPSLPMFLERLDDGDGIGIGIAMSTFLLASVFGLLVGQQLCSRMAVKSAILIGIMISAIGTLAHVLGNTWQEIALYRAVAGLGYGVVYAAAQVFIVDHSDTHRVTTGFSLFFIAVVGADIAGPAIGGIIAESLGQSLVFLVATSALALSFLTCSAVLPSEKPKANLTRPTEEKFGALRKMLSSSRFLVLSLGLAFPSKFLLNGGLFLCLPLAVTEFGNGAAVAGQMFMIYGIVVLLCSGWIARATDRWNLLAPMVCAGTTLSAGSLALPALLGSQWSLMLCVAIFAMGQAMSVPAQMSFLLRLTPHEQKMFGRATIIAQYRMMERVGSFFGPLIGAALIGLSSPKEALIYMGLTTMILSGLAATFFLIVGEQDEEDQIDALLVKS
jgi:MFS family permease/HAMP domain-containing protein